MPTFKHKVKSAFEFRTTKAKKINPKMINAHSLDIAVLKAKSRVFSTKLRAYYHLGIPHLI